MARIYYRSVPYDKNSITLALEAGVDGIIVPRENAASVASLARCDVIADEDVHFISINAKEDEINALERMKAGEIVTLADGWEVIPVENLLAQVDDVFVEAKTPEAAHLAAGILEKGVAAIVAPAESIGCIRDLVAQCKIKQTHEDLQIGRITRIMQAGLGHRVCIDTLSLLKRGQGMLVGNSSAFTFLVHAETEHNEYVASRPFRVNAGGVHAYIRLPNDKTTYLGEIRAGDHALIIDYNGDASIATVGRVKIEVRPMLMIEAETTLDNGEKRIGSIFLQNAETIRLTSPNGTPVSVVALKPGDEVLCRLDQAGRHFGMRVNEDIKEI